MTPDFSGSSEISLSERRRRLQEKEETSLTCQIQKMDNRTTFIAILSLAALYEAFANQCTYSTFTGMKTLQDSVLESFIVDHYYNDCEYLCYKNPSKCLAANLVPDENDTFRCEFISLNSTTKLILEPNPKGKHISRLSGKNTTRSLWYCFVFRILSILINRLCEI